MGYTHGKRWSDEEIRIAILGVVDALGLDRMPSRSECEAHFRDCSLTNAISRRHGWYKTAQLLGLSVKKSESFFGKAHETIAADQLTSLGYGVRQMSQNFPYDLLVEDCIKVDVKASRLYRGTMGNFYSFNLEKPYTTCDIYVLHLVDDFGNVSKTLVLPSKFVSTQNQISVGEKHSKYDAYANRWDYFAAYVQFLCGIS